MYDPKGCHQAEAYDAAEVRVHFEGDERLKYAMELRFFVVETIPEDETLVPKHVAVGT
jgi:hypothetical protein